MTEYGNVIMRVFADSLQAAELVAGQMNQGNVWVAEVDKTS